ncbi:hypothetical protein [Saccharopolyspora soli]|uniref:hypothetical protein n=1 Tax=Saccharopolyspora soli TaxID=2926618 RepID=UPI0035567C0D
MLEFRQLALRGLRGLLRARRALHSCGTLLPSLGHLPLGLFLRRLDFRCRLHLGLFHGLARVGDPLIGLAAGRSDGDFGLVARGFDVLLRPLFGLMCLLHGIIPFLAGAFGVLPGGFRGSCGILGRVFGGTAGLLGVATLLLRGGQGLLGLRDAVCGFGLGRLDLRFSRTGISDGSEFRDASAQIPGQLLRQEAVLPEQLLGPQPRPVVLGDRHRRRWGLLLHRLQPLPFLPRPPPGVLGKIAVLRGTSRPSGAQHISRTPRKPAGALGVFLGSYILHRLLTHARTL